MICLLLSPIIFGAEKPHSFTPKWPRLVRHEGCRTTRGELPRGHKCCGTDECDVGDESSPFWSAGSAPTSRNHCLTPQLRHCPALIFCGHYAQKRGRSWDCGGPYERSTHATPIGVAVSGSSWQSRDVTDSRVNFAEIMKRSAPHTHTALPIPHTWQGCERDEDFMS